MPATAETFFAFTSFNDADHDLPLRRSDERHDALGAAQGRVRPGRLRRRASVSTRRRTAPGCRCSWSSKKGVDRPRADPALRLWRLQHLDDAGLLADAAGLDRSGRRGRGRQPSRRRRIWQGVARCRAPRQQAERVRRFHRRRRISDQAKASPPRTSSRSRAARTAACWSARWSTSAPTCSRRRCPRWA